MAKLYLLHFVPAFKHARHYLGYTSFADVLKRIKAHQQGKGATLTRHAVRAGCKLMLAWVRDGERADERRMKRAAHVAKDCPLCKRMKRK